MLERLLLAWLAVNLLALALFVVVGELRAYHARRRRRLPL